VESWGISLGRGRLLKSKVKETIALTFARLKGQRKFYKKHPDEWFKDRISSLFSNMTFNDILELVAIAGMTVVIKNMIDASEDLLNKINQMQVPEAFLTGFIRGFTGFQIPVLGFLFRQTEITEAFEIADPLKWLISFCMAFVIVHHFDSLMKAFGSIQGFLTSAFSVAVT